MRRQSEGELNAQVVMGVDEETHLDFNLAVDVGVRPNTKLARDGTYLRAEQVRAAVSGRNHQNGTRTRRPHT